MYGDYNDRDEDEYEKEVLEDDGVGGKVKTYYHKDGSGYTNFGGMGGKVYFDKFGNQL